MTWELIPKVIEFAKTKTDMPDEDSSVIMQLRKSLLFIKEMPWIKK